MRALGKWCQRVVAVVSVGLLLAACQTSSPASRIEENPVLFRALSPEQQLMVQQGRICKGMSKEAVFLAWGNPGSAPLKGEREGKAYERWVYTRERAVPVDTIGGGWYGGPWGHRGWYEPYGGMSVMYVPEEAATVTFEQDKVTEWESRGKVGQ